MNSNNISNNNDKNREKAIIPKKKERANKKVSNEPARRLIESRLPRVKDWNRLENDSRTNRININNSILVKNKYNKNEIMDKPIVNRLRFNDTVITNKLKR